MQKMAMANTSGDRHFYSLPPPDAGLSSSSWMIQCLDFELGYEPNPARRRTLYGELLNMKMRILLSLMLGLAASAMAQPSADKPASATVEKPATTVKRVQVEEFDKLRASKENIVLDVRTAREYKAGHIPGAVNIDVNAPDFAEKVGKLEKSKTYLVHCAGGVRSAKACRKLETMGFQSLYDLAPGFRGWERAGKPVEK